VEARYRPALLARDVDAGTNLQALLVSAVTAVLLTRLYLSVTGYPRVGSGPLHIAHLLWGGLLMLAALIILLSVLGKRARRVAAIIGGLGFGLFVDELGKFVTADNDYFFQPAVALIYVLFILLFLVFRAIERRSLSPLELLANAADMLPELVLGGATRAELARTRLLLNHSGAQGAVPDGLRQAIAGAPRTPQHRSVFTGAVLSAWRTYDRLLEWPWFQRAIWLVFVGQAVLGVFATLAVGWSTFRGRPADSVPATLATSTISLALVLVGVMRLPRSQLDAYRWFERSILVSVFFTQVIMFWQDQLTALSGLFWDLLLLAVLRFLIRQEAVRNVTEH